VLVEAIELLISGEDRAAPALRRRRRRRRRRLIAAACVEDDLQWCVRCSRG
jgi:hypothetical protein